MTGRLGAVPIEFADEPDELEEPVVSAGRFPLLAWWLGLDPTERVLYRGLGLLAAGFAVIWWPLALIVPGAIVTAIAVLSFFATIKRGAD